MKRFVAALLFACALADASAANAQPPQAGAASRLEVGFSPDGSAEALVLSAINSAHQSIRVAAYAFTAPAVVRALVAAKRRGVDVAVVVDFKQNIELDRSGRARAALNLLVNAGIPTRTIDVFPIQHSKFAVIDGQHVQTGSYNYTQAAAQSNSENVLVVWSHPGLAGAYLDNWKQLFDAGRNYTANY